MQTRQFLKKRNQEQLSLFLLSDKTEWIMRNHASIPGFTFGLRKVRWTKKKFELGEGKGSIFLVFRGNHLHGMEWRSSAKTMSKAIDYGLNDDAVSPDAMVVNTLGKSYRQEVFRRAYDDRVISDQYCDKEALVNFAQSYQRALFPLTQLLTPFPKIESAVRVLTVLEMYRLELFRLLQSDFITVIKRHDQYFSLKIYQQIDLIVQMKQRLKEKRNKTELLKYLRLLLSSHHPESLRSLINNTLVKSLRQFIQEPNQNMSYQGRRWTRGFVNSAVIDGIKVMQDATLPHHARVLSLHQGSYVDEGKPITAYFQGNVETLRMNLMAILQLEEVDCVENGKLKLKRKKGDTSDPIAVSLNQTAYVTQQMNSKSSRFLIWLFHVLIGVATLPIDLMVGLVVYPFLKDNTPCLFSYAWISLENKEIEDTLFSEIEKEIKIPHRSLGVRVWKIVEEFALDPIWEVFRGVYFSFKAVFWEFLLDVRDDYHLIRIPVSEEVILSRLKGEVRYRQFLDKNVSRLIAEEHQKQYGEPIIPVMDDTVLVSTLRSSPFPLVHKKRDGLNALARGYKIFMESFSHPIHAKHSLTGVLFTGLYFAGILASMGFPEVAFLGKAYIRFSTEVGSAMAHGTSGAVSSGLLQGQFGSSFCELVVNWSRSWLFSGARMLEKDITDVMLYSSAAVGMGYAVVFKLKIPWVSQFLKDDMGTLPFIALGVGGGKLAIVLVELLESETGTHFSEAVQQKKEERLREALKECYCHVHHLTTLSSAEEEEIEQSAQFILNELKKNENEEWMLSINNKIKKLRHAVQTNQLTDEMKKLRFLHRIEANADFLPRLDNIMKRQLINLAKNHFPDDPAVVEAIKEKIYPQHSYSIIVTTFKMFADYVPLLLRILCYPVTCNRDAVDELGSKLFHDISLLIHAIGSILSTTIHFWQHGIPIRGCADVIAHEVGARVESTTSSESSLAAAAYEATTAVDCVSFRGILAKLGIDFIDDIERATDAPNPELVLGDANAQLIQGYFERKKSDELQQGESKELMPRQHADMTQSL